MMEKENKYPYMAQTARASFGPTSLTSTPYFIQERGQLRPAMNAYFLSWMELLITRKRFLNDELFRVLNGS